MKINKKIVGMMIAISVLVFGTGIASHAMNERTEKIQKIEAYVQEVRKLNSELATTLMNNYINILQIII